MQQIFDFLLVLSQSECMKLIKISLGVILLMLVILTIVFWTPDTSFEQMTQKYAVSPSNFIELENGDRLHYRDQGSVNESVLVLIHGTSASLHTWQPLIESIGHRFRMISLDLPGHGFTGSNARRDYSRKAMVSSIWRLLDHLNIRSATLVGNSLGGAVAWESALDSPERVNSLILLAPSGAPKKTESKSNIGFKILRTSLGQALMKKISPRSIIAASLHQTVAVPEIVTEGMIDRYWELLRLPGNRQAMIDLANTPRDKHAWKKLSTISAPTLVIWGEQDQVLPVTMIVTFDSELQNVRVERLRNVGHLPMEEAVKEVSDQIIGFCESNDC